MPSRSAMSAAHENAALSRKVSKSGDTARRRSVIAAVSARTDSWSSSVASAPSGRIAHSSWSRSSGSPARTSTRDRSATLSSNQRPTGTIWMSSTPCAFAPSAIRAAPVRIGARRGMSCVVPSGKTAIVPPSRSSASASSKARRFAAPAPPSTCRWIGITPASARRGLTRITFQSVAFARNRGSRPSAETTSTGSANPLKWFATTSVGRRLSSRSKPAVSTFR